MHVESVNLWWHLGLFAVYVWKQSQGTAGHDKHLMNTMSLNTERVYT